MKYVYDGDLTPTANRSRLIEISAANAGEAVEALEQIALSLSRIDYSLGVLASAIKKERGEDPMLRICGELWNN